MQLYTKKGGLGVKGQQLCQSVVFLNCDRHKLLLFADDSSQCPFNREIYRQRNFVERAINRLKQFRRIATL